MVFAQFSEQHEGKFGEPRAVGGRQTAEVSEEGGAQVTFYPLTRCWTLSEMLSSVSLDVSSRTRSQSPPRGSVCRSRQLVHVKSIEQSLALLLGAC